MPDALDDELNVTLGELLRQRLLQVELPEGKGPAPLDLKCALDA